MEPMISFQNVSKKFSRNIKRAMFYGVKDLLSELVGRKKSTDLRPTEFWALDGISFELNRGESLGFIGHNGAGKTTSLKLINGLIAPDKGEIKVQGKIGALIALGAGFNPVLTGRENIKISAAALGYTEQEIEERIDEIIEFSEIGEFIDAPVQSYSSGMMARLGFSVAIHTSPDILLVDEVLAVGDLNFVIKCFKKIHDFRNHGGSIILVSHNLYAIRANCDKVLWIEKGQVRGYGDTKDVCDEYEDYVNSQTAVQGEEFFSSVLSLKNIQYNDLIDTEDLEVDIEIEFKQNIKDVIISLSLFSLAGVNVSSTCHNVESVEAGVFKTKAKFLNTKLSRGNYYLNLVVAEGNINNQLAAVINRYKIKVERKAKFVGEGLCSFDSTWVNL